MPKKSKKSKSKRMTLRQKYKIIKKVREHARKKRKEERKSAAAGVKKKAPKDPGLPSQWPYKEELVKEFAFLRAQALAEEKRKKEGRKASAQALDSKAMELEGDAAQLMVLARLQASASNKQADFESRKRARLTEEFTSDQDNSRKAFYREFRRVVEASDVIIQVLDARDPLACRCPDVERYIRQTNPSKKIILLLNKMDLVPREVGERWLKYFREELPTVAFKCSTQQQGRGLGQKKMPQAAAAKAEDGMQSSVCLGAETLLQLLKNYTRNAGIKTAITVGVIGMPNVGKSSLINSLKRARVAQVGNTPGVTKSVQEVVLDKHIKLLDSPGVVFASAESAAAAALRNAVKVERLEDPAAPVAEILKRVPAKKLMELYKIQTFSSTEEFLQLIAHARGKLRRGGLPDALAAARVVLQDWNDGKIPYFTTPPARPKTGLESAELVTTWAAEFNADEVFAAEKNAVIAHLPSMDDADYIEAEAVGEGKADMAAMDASSSDDDDEEGAGPSGMDEDGDEGDMLAAAAAALARRDAGKAAALSQNTTLYDEEGQYNPHAARADRKRQKRQRLSGEGADGEDGPGTSGRGAAGKKQQQGKNKKPHPYGGDSDGDDDDEGDFDFDAMNAKELRTKKAGGGDGMESSGSDDEDEGGEGESDDDGEGGEGEGEDDEDDEGMSD